ncbi:phosphoenolpyruvate--protein phosphotransferase [Gracilinema caldarium]|uniref:Phosphoenolpyruvate-protein phosphotransferase n=1 Tax=Gracilinema caldarium (strain ATCC 51460 / DSM 7334 / H1) TaxID=744872 RepID=F8F338_GRAC1|nr:phosphoenolpyruvate--protein phosphotransferase [Gracilinema caldarium]AEJ20364.1 phosphoenolpyruvate-protein phosphotransferase [Gracilinema caldarium DSM 7334]
MTVTLQGIPASPGVAIGPVYFIEPTKTTQQQSPELCANSPEVEWQHFTKALEQAKEQVTFLRDKTQAELGTEKAEIFASHLSILRDPEFLAEIRKKISDEHKSAVMAVKETGDLFIELLRQVQDELFMGRINDIEDIVHRLVQNIQGDELGTLHLQQPSIVAAKDLTPSETASLDRAMVLAFITEGGSALSHSSILARSLGIPAVVGLGPLPDLHEGSSIIVDGITGTVIINPHADILSEYEQKRSAYIEEQSLIRHYAGKPSVTRDGVPIEIAANIGSLQDLDGVLTNGADGIGLFRTEFMFMDRPSMPSEDEQFEVYKFVLQRMKGKPVVIRTLDVGGDKQIPYIELEQEANPFLGVRAIRLCLQKETLFRTQIRALLRASSFGKLRILLPMIATLEELRAAKKIIAEETTYLQQSGISISDSWELGIMIEIPSAALLANHFAQEVDFFSVGTNDLTQYTMAADRMNRSLTYLHQGLTPAVLQLIELAAKAARAHGIWIGVCGELAGDPELFPLFIGLGITELSMGSASIPKIRSRLAHITLHEAAQWASQASTMESSEAIYTYMKGVLS